MNFFRKDSPPLPTEAEFTREYGPLRAERGLAIMPIQAAAIGRPRNIARPLAPPAIQDFTPILWAGRRMTPDQVRFILQAAVGGNLQDQWALFDMMEDTWPHLAKNLTEVRRSAARATLAVQPYTERGEPPTDSAKERADLVECALRNWRPQPGTLELNFEDAGFHALDCLGKGLSILELTWQSIDEGILPRCAHLLHPSKYGWNPEGTELGLVSSGSQLSALDSQLAWQPFPPGQFWVGIWHSRSGAPGHTALLRSLAPYWCGVTFGWEWLLNNAQIFGVPLRWATYDPNQPELLPTLTSMLQNLGSAGWAAFPQGTTMDFKEAVQRGADNPQVFIQTLADRYCDQLILGQEASGQQAGDGLGAGSGQLHGDVRDARLQDAAQWWADLLNYQLVPALLRLNFGDESEPPAIAIDDAGETDPQAKATRDVALAALAPLPAKWFYERHAIPQPEEDEEVIGGAPVQPAGFGDPSMQLPGQPGSSDHAAPGQPSDAGSPETGQTQEPDKSTPGADSAAVNGKVAGRASEARSVNPPRSAVALRAGQSTLRRFRRGVLPHGAKTLPGDYRIPEATRRTLTDAHLRDLAPLRQAAEPLLAAIDAGSLDVVGELEAFIARLDAMAPQMIGAGELADALESALAEAAIAGAAGIYRKLPEQRSTS